MFSVYGGGQGFAARLCNEEKDKENPGANSSLGANIPFAADDEWYPHIFKDSQSNGWRMSYNETPVSVESFHSLRLVRKAPDIPNHYFVFFATEHNGTWALLFKVKKDTAQSKGNRLVVQGVDLCCNVEMEGQMLQSVGRESFDALCQQTLPRWIEEEHAVRAREQGAKRQAKKRASESSEQSEERLAGMRRRNASLSSEQKEERLAEMRQYTKEWNASLSSEQNEERLAVRREASTYKGAECELVVGAE